VSDRAAAEIFGTVFEALARDDFDQVLFAKELMQMTFNYDFNSYQLCCDQALLKLGLAKRTTDADGEPMLLYYGDKGYK